MLSEIENGYYATISQLVKMNNSPAVIGGDWWKLSGSYTFRGLKGPVFGFCTRDLV